MIIVEAAQFGWAAFFFFYFVNRFYPHNNEVEGFIK